MDWQSASQQYLPSDQHPLFMVQTRRLIVRATPYLVGVIGATLFSAVTVSAQAAGGTYYDPTNVGSQNGNTTGYELYRTIGCPGQQLLGTPCAVPPPKPTDKDGDGVVDSKDKCPNTQAGRKVNADGCELDSDGDGVVDGQDRCPNTPAGRKVGADGCELDTDGDGIVDGVDKCPTVFAKTADGCPLPVAPAPAPAPKKLVLEGVNFDNDQATLRTGDIAVLDQAAASLKEWGDIKVEVAGHTDSKSSDSYNMQLSARRAAAVREYLIGKGVAADRLTAKGYGESQPVADNNTEEGRFKNRRVELVPVR
jgi:outer membrane protein OmpA-like peptidoglycan-associated protein